MKDLGEMPPCMKATQAKKCLLDLLHKQFPDVPWRVDATGTNGWGDAYVVVGVYTNFGMVPLRAADGPQGSFSSWNEPKSIQTFAGIMWTADSGGDDESRDYAQDYFEVYAANGSYEPMDIPLSVNPKTARDFVQFLALHLKKQMRLERTKLLKEIAGRQRVLAEVNKILGGGAARL